ncbi:MAG: VOC family protein [Thermoanaerobaculia bacterium]|nr:VOC family protein [Thermoanaerobaculia bacterium]
MSESTTDSVTNYPALAPSLCVQDAPAAIRWYRSVFGAEELLRLTAPDGSIVHAELRIERCLVMLGEEAPGQGDEAPPSLGGTPVRLHLYVDDVDRVVRRAVSEGAEILIRVADQFYGDRAGRFRDPYGHVWIVATRVETVATEEMQRRLERLAES